MQITISLNGIYERNLYVTIIVKKGDFMWWFIFTVLFIVSILYELYKKSDQYKNSSKVRNRIISYTPYYLNRISENIIDKLYYMRLILPQEIEGNKVQLYSDFRRLLYDYLDLNKFTLSELEEIESRFSIYNNHFQEIRKANLSFEETKELEKTLGRKIGEYMFEKNKNWKSMIDGVTEKTDVIELNKRINNL